jgi:hypothetical protein
VTLFAVPFLVMGTMMIGGIFFVIYGIIGAVMAFQGKPFRYILIGKRIEHFMQPKSDTVANQ